MCSKRCWFARALVTLMVLGIVGMGVVPAKAADPTGEAAKPGPFKIAVSMRGQDQDRWVYDVKSMQAKAKELGDEIVVQWAQDDPMRQQSQIENMIAQGIDALIMVPVSNTGAPKLVKMAKDAGIPVIGYDTAIPNADVDWVVTRNNYDTGFLQVKGCLDMFPPNKEHPPNIALIKGDVTNFQMQYWNKIYHDVLDPLVKEGTVKIVSEQWHPRWTSDGALKTAETALTAAQDNLQCFVTANDSMAIGVAQAIKARGLEGKTYLSGLDAQITNLRQIVDGVQTMSIWTQIDKMGEAAAQAAHDLAAGKQPASDEMVNNEMKDIPTKYIDIYVVNKDNVCEWVTKVAPAGWAKAEDIFQDRPLPDACKQVPAEKQEPTTESK